MIQLQTKRLVLRPWQPADLDPFIQLNGDPKVMEYFPAVRNSQETEQEFQRIVKGFETYGWGFWAAALIPTNQFIGFIGLKYVNAEFPFAPAVEIGWRLAFEHWGKGYATEGAMEALRCGFETLNFPEIVSYTPAVNQRSRNVMEKIGMQCNEKDTFDHPYLAENHPLRKHVLYRIKKIA